MSIELRYVTTRQENNDAKSPDKSLHSVVERSNCEQR